MCYPLHASLADEVPPGGFSMNGSGTAAVTLALVLGLLAPVAAQKAHVPAQVIETLNSLFYSDMIGEGRMNDDIMKDMVIVPEGDGQRGDKLVEVSLMLLYIATLFAEPGTQVVEEAGDVATVTYDPNQVQYLLKHLEGKWKLDTAATYETLPEQLMQILQHINGGRGRQDFQAACLTHLKNIALAFMMYAEDRDGCFPDATKWMDELSPYLKNEVVFQCPAAPDLPWGYAMNAGLSRRDIAEIDDPSVVAIAFDSHYGTQNAAGGPEAVCNPPRHEGGNNYAYADGHVAWQEDIPSFGDFPLPDVATVPGAVGVCTDGTFAEAVLQAERPVIVLFWARADEDSAQMNNTLRALAGTYADAATFTAVNAAVAPKTVEAQGVTTYPTLLFYRDGEILDRLVGAWDRDAVEVWLQVKVGD
jgi:thioredoxin 1